MKNPSNLTMFKSFGNNISNAFESFKSTLYKNYGENPGKMLVHTGVLGWILSSLAQVTAIVFNDKISSDQKAFLIPQEVGDAAANILSFYVLTSSVTRLGSKLVKTGKLTTKPIKEFIEKQNPLMTKNGEAKVGNLNYNIELLDKFDDIKGKYKPFKNGVDIASSAIGSIISCNIVTPLLRNTYASERQKAALAKKNVDQNNPAMLKAPRGISMDRYQQMASMKFSSNSLKV